MYELCQRGIYRRYFAPKETALWAVEMHFLGNASLSDLGTLVRWLRGEVGVGGYAVVQGVLLCCCAMAASAPLLSAELLGF